MVPAGVGKTYLAKAVANEIGAHFLYVNGPEIVSSVRGGTEANLRQIFNEAMENSPSVVLIDELDAIAPERGQSGMEADVRMGTQLLPQQSCSCHRRTCGTQARKPPGSPPIN